MKGKKLFSGWVGNIKSWATFRVNESKPVMIFVYSDRIELWVQTFDGKNLKTEMKKFDYRDLILMNDTLNKIMRPINEKNH
jgi:hypothetical protein